MADILFFSGLEEFGWAIATYIPACRYLAKNYDRRIVICKPNTEYLYNDFANVFHNYSKDGRSDRWLFCDKKIKVPQKFSKLYPKAILKPPDKHMCQKTPRKYFKYGTFNEKKKYDLVIHARSEAKYGRNDRNWPVGKYMKLVTLLREEKEMSICSIGTKKGSYHVPHTNDRRGISLKELCDILASSKLCVGVSSGPMHLAMFCGCPIVVWTGNEWQKAIKGTNRARYKKIWNPFNIEAKVIDKHGWKPPVRKVLKAVKDRIL